MSHGPRKGPKIPFTELIFKVKQDTCELKHPPIKKQKVTVIINIICLEGLTFQNVSRDFNEEALIPSIIFHFQCTQCFAIFLQTSNQTQAFTGHLRGKV